MTEWTVMAEDRALVTVSEALRVIAAHVRPLPIIRVPLAEAAGLTLAEPIRTDIDQPPFDRAVMDGYAVRSSDVGGSRTTLWVVGELAAGQTAARAVGPGEAVRTNTGAPMPPGTDAVVMVEDVGCSVDGRQITTSASLRPGEHVTRRGEYIRAGGTVLEPPVRLGAAQVAAAAAAGAAHLAVYRRPRMAILVTGDELVPVGERPSGGRVRNSNGVCLLALAREAGCEVVDLGVVGDRMLDLADKVSEGLAAADVLCVSGGVSAGQHDLVPAVLADAGVKLEMRKVAVKPGRPTTFGVGPQGQAVLGLPGNPVSCLVCFLVFARAVLAALQGRGVSLPPAVRGILDSPLPPTGLRAEYLPARMSPAAAGDWRVTSEVWRGSGDLFGLARANGLVIREAYAPAAETGTAVPVIPLDW